MIYLLDLYRERRRRRWADGLVTRAETELIHLTGSRHELAALLRAEGRDRTRAAIANAAVDEDGWAADLYLLAATFYAAADRLENEQCLESQRSASQSMSPSPSANPRTPSKPR